MNDDKVFLFAVEMGISNFTHPAGKLDFDLRVNGYEWMTTSEMEEFQNLVSEAGSIVRNALIRKLVETSTDNDEDDDYYDEEWED